MAKLCSPKDRTEADTKFSRVACPILVIANDSSNVMNVQWFITNQ